MGEGIIVAIIMGVVAVLYFVTGKMFLSLVLGFVLFTVFAVFFSNISEFIDQFKSRVKKETETADKPRIPVKSVLIWTIILLCTIALSIHSVSKNISSSSGNGKYDYVTNGDGTRTWYDATNDHIIRVD